ncbi:MAG TPA: VOC family protein [Dehalococcoidia bacterium]|nr:VOC family protein [Dehalococcoidia bacterium]
MQGITPFLWFNDQAEEAVNFYVSLFPDSRVVEMSRVEDPRPGQSRSMAMATFELCGQRFMALNGGPTYQFSPAISLFVHCDDQAEIDGLWAALSADGGEEQCGWVRDRFGVTWQIVPTMLGEVLGGPDAAGAKRARDAMLGMQKLDIAALRRAYAGGG